MEGQISVNPEEYAVTDPRFQNVTSPGGRAARDTLIEIAEATGFSIRCGGSRAVPHLRFERYPGDVEYPFSLNLNTVTPTFYVRFPKDSQIRHALKEFVGANVNPRGELKIPVSDARVAAKVADHFIL